MTNAELIALLREARESVLKLADEYESLRLSVRLEQEQRDLVSRIDAALAAHEAEERVEVKWKDRMGEYIHDDGVNRLRVYLWADLWRWHTTVEYRADGYKHTLDEAKSAAIAAARGME